MSALGRRYAKALLDLAREQGELDSVLRDVGSLSDAWKASAEFREIVRNPDRGWSEVIDILIARGMKWEDAHRIARERGGNVIMILKEMVETARRN